MANHKLTLDEIAEIINDDDFGNSLDIDGLSYEDDNTEVETAAYTGIQQVEESEQIEDPESENEPVITNPPKKRKVVNKKEKVQWVRKNFASAPAHEDANEEDNDDDEDSYAEPDSPYKYFMQFISNEFIENMCEKTGMYYFQKTSKHLNTTSQEIKILIDIHIEIGSILFPNLRLYWSKTRHHK